MTDSDLARQVRDVSRLTGEYLVSGKLLSLAASLEDGSEHPVGRAVAEAAHQGGARLKVIIETCLLTDEQKVLACEAAGVRPILGTHLVTDDDRDAAEWQRHL